MYWNQKILFIIKNGLLVLLLLFVSRCSSNYKMQPVSIDHPANPDAQQSSFEDSSNNTNNEISMNHSNHEMDNNKENKILSIELSDELGKFLDAYFTIGERISSDSLSDISDESQKLSQRLEKLITTTIPDQPHFWHERTNDIQIIREQAKLINTSNDIQSVRISFGILSDAIDRFIRDTGIPPRYDKPVFRFVCGMFKDVPNGGIWYQFDETAKNPYFGLQMTSCHSQQIELPKAVLSSPTTPPVMPMQEHNEHQHQM